MQFIVSLTDIVATLCGIGAIQYVATTWLKARLEASIKSEKDRILEDYKYEIKAREQASKVAEYFSYYFRLRPDSSEADYRKANQLAWELALWLPEETYRLIAKAVATNTEEANILSALIAVRKLLLKSPGALTHDDIFFHAPNARELRNEHEIT